MDFYDYLFQESYIGKTKYMIEAEKVLDKMINLMCTDTTIDFTNHPLNQQLEKLFVQQFGFKRIYILWQNMPMYALNGCTMTSSDILYNPKLVYEKDKKKGFYDKNHQRIAYIQINQKLVKNIKFTGGEALGVILHEIGHNFDDSIYKRLDCALMYIKFARIDIEGIREHGKEFIRPLIHQIGMILSTQTNFGHKVLAEINKRLEKIIQLCPFLRKIEDMLSQVYDFAMNIDFIATILTLDKQGWIDEVTGIYKLITHFPEMQMRYVLTRKSEQFADSFATAYGYGPELASALDKLDYNTWFHSMKSVEANNNKVYKIFADIKLFENEIVNFVLSGHGTTGTRVQSVKREIIKDIKTADYPPELKKDIMDSVKEIDDVYEKVLKCHGDGKQFLLTSLTRRGLNIIFGGRSDIVARLFPDNTVRTAMQTHKERRHDYYDKFSRQD